MARTWIVLGAIILGASLCGAMVACLVTQCDLVVSAPSSVNAGSNLVIIASSDNAPVKIEAMVGDDHLPGSPDNGSTDPTGVNTGVFSTNGLDPGTLITVRITDGGGQTMISTVIVSSP